MYARHVPPTQLDEDGMDEDGLEDGRSDDLDEGSVAEDGMDGDQGEWGEEELAVCLAVCLSVCLTGMSIRWMSTAAAINSHKARSHIMAIH
ncbi:unnamed protein product [Vitrella brassicaformis CCMP3155]|uniref:Uncharacterized protein n=1 Tax=Vitrella brassicaformis (strain CCMP3155) TaxID=1169540 RepID=A0A0G4H1G8_VITBC|nr:unnamed protein product [Vitrella brassicaformis CCMP3155]|eukprot:CEM37454.1 unnamed protein product [Vitrella brassicaformis CCMP3155]